MRAKSIAFLLALCLSASPALAHKMKVFAAVEGDVISGYAYFSPGGRAQDIAISIATPDGAVTTTTSDDQGNFRYQARLRADHLITADGGDGHTASAAVPAADLPSSLPLVPGAVPVQAPAPAATSQPSDKQDDLKAFIDASLSRQIRPLREQIDAYQEKIWMHDVLGGLGVIMGLGGLAYGLAERRRRPRHDD